VNADEDGLALQLLAGAVAAVVASAWKAERRHEGDKGVEGDLVVRPASFLFEKYDARGVGHGLCPFLLLG
jgi:hypothetical protein